MIRMRLIQRPEHDLGTPRSRFEESRCLAVGLPKLIALRLLLSYHARQISRRTNSRLATGIHVPIIRATSRIEREFSFTTCLSWAARTWRSAWNWTDIRDRCWRSEVAGFNDSETLNRLVDAIGRATVCQSPLPHCVDSATIRSDDARSSGRWRNHTDCLIHIVFINLSRQTHHKLLYSPEVVLSVQVVSIACLRVRE